MPQKKIARAKPKVIDAHGHIKWYGYDARKLVENMDQYGIDVMWLLSWEAPDREIDPEYLRVFWPGRRCIPMEDVLEAVQQYPDRFVPFYAPDPREPMAIKRLEGMVKMMGVRGCGELKVQIMMDDPFALELFHFCGENNLPVIFHMDVPLPRWKLGRSPGYWFCCDWENLGRALERCPKTTFIGHGPAFWREISGDADSEPDPYPRGPVTPGGRLWQYLDRHPNLWCDLSATSGAQALARDLEVGRRFYMTYQDRIVFGRDYFDDAQVQVMKKCNLPKAVTDKIMGGNALRLVPL